jgi:hypothetical protein
MDSLQKLCENRKVIIETVLSPSMPAGYAYYDQNSDKLESHLIMAQRKYTFVGHQFDKGSGSIVLQFRYRS